MKSEATITTHNHLNRPKSKESMSRAGQRTRSVDYESERRKIELEEQLLAIREKRLDLEEKRIQLQLRKLELRKTRIRNRKGKSSSSSSSGSRGSRQTAREDSPDAIERRSSQSGDEDIISDEEEDLEFRRQSSIRRGRSMRGGLSGTSDDDGLMSDDGTGKLRRTTQGRDSGGSPSSSTHQKTGLSTSNHQQSESPGLTDEQRSSMVKNLNAIDGLKELRFGRRGSAPLTSDAIPPQANATVTLLKNKHLSLRDLRGMSSSSSGSHGRRSRGRARSTDAGLKRRASSADSRTSVCTEATEKISNQSSQRHHLPLESPIMEEAIDFNRMRTTPLFVTSES